jgi:glycosyltransferase involved in cell wall biosynthesis
MDLAFLCGLFPEHMEQEIISQSIGRIDFAANNLQWSFVKGLDFHNKKPVKLLNSLYIGAFPKGYKKLIVETESFSHSIEASDINIGFLNLVGIKIFSRFFSTFYYTNKWAKDKREEKKVLLIYAMHTPFLISAALTKRINKKIKLCLIVPDLPQYMSDNKSLVHRILKYLDSKLIKFLIKQIDCFVLLSEFMGEKINVEQRPCVRIEGIFDDNTISSGIVEKQANIKKIMYSGNLDISQGIIDLLSAFSEIRNENYRLWFTGHGNGLKYITEAIKRDHRIQYFENLTKTELQAKQREATLLINPLNPTNPKVKYFFPSKTMEYLASGVVTLMYKLPSIPSEYNDCLYFFDGYTVDVMRDKIIEICEKSTMELDNFGAKAKAFILEFKTPIPQCEKLYNTLLKL